MTRPIILCSTGRYLNNAGTGHLMACGPDYSASIVRAGGAPILLPAHDNKEAVQTIMHQAHGLLLTGGADLDSKNFDEELHPKAKGIDPERDGAELEAARFALDNGMPVFGICRGCQVLNVAMGGKLIQDIPSFIDTDILHQTQSKDLNDGHIITIESNSLLSKIMGCTETMVNSRHHQAVKEPGKGLKINAHAEDGVIEGIESDSGLPILGLQCHPENSTADYPRFQNLFDWFFHEAERFRNGKSDFGKRK